MTAIATAPAAVTADHRAVLVLENRHTGERLEMRRVRIDGKDCLEMNGSLPPRGEGPPMHVHHAEAEEFHVVSGVLSAEADGKRVRLLPGESALFPPGSAHRWWNADDEPLMVRGFVIPERGLDRYLQAAFEVINASPAGRPSMFYMAHLAWRHRREQVTLVIPPVVQRVLFPLLIGIGTMLGKYRGTSWPGSPDRCRGLDSPPRG